MRRLRRDIRDSLAVLQPRNPNGGVNDPHPVNSENNNQTLAIPETSCRDVSELGNILALITDTDSDDEWFASSFSKMIQDSLKLAAGLSKEVSRDKKRPEDPELDTSSFSTDDFDDSNDNYSPDEMRNRITDCFDLM